MRKLLGKISDSILKFISRLYSHDFKEKIINNYPLVYGKYKLPLNYDALPSRIQDELRLGYELEEKFVYQLENVLVSSDGIVFKNFNLFKPTIINEYVNSLLDYNFLLRQFVSGSKSIIKFSEPIVVVHDMWSKNYYHWIVDLLPKLLIINNDIKNYAIIFPENNYDYTEFTLRALGCANIVNIKSGVFIKADTVIIPERTAIGAYQNPELLLKVRQLLLDAIKPMSINKYKRVYVSRSKSSKRRVLNEGLLMDMLKKYAFECVFFEELSFIEQVNLLWNTQILVGAHGANLVNILFMQKKAALIELINSNYTNLVYFRMSSILDIAYYMLPCSTNSEFNINQNDVNYENDLDIIVDLNILEEIIRGL